MGTTGEQQRRQDERTWLIDDMASRLAPDMVERPSLGDVLVESIDDRFDALRAQDEAGPVPEDSGLAQLIGLGPTAAKSLNETRLPERVAPYDEGVGTERIGSMADLYYLYQHERLGVFQVVEKLKELFRAGAVRLSSGEGALRLYRYDRRGVLRYTTHDRRGAYLRAFGYGPGPLPPGGRANTDFDSLFFTFARHVSKYWSDKRISDVIRERANDPSYGSVAITRRSGLALRNNLRFTSYGDVSVMRVEVLQLLDEAFRIVGSPDVRSLFGADSAWDVIDEVLARYFGVTPNSSARQRLAVSGRSILQWLAQPFILEEGRTQFEAKLRFIGDDADELLASAASLRAGRTVRSPLSARRAMS